MAGEKKKPEETLQSVLEQIDISEENRTKLISGEYDFDKDFKTPFQDTFISRKLARNDEDLKKEHIGTFARVMSDTMRKKFELTQSQIEDKKYEEIIDMGIEKYSNKITELEEKVKSPEDKEGEIKKLQESFEKIKEKAQKSEDDLLQANRDKEELKQNSDAELKKFKMSFMLSSAIKDLDYVDDIKPITKKGFEASILEKYKFDFEDDKLIVTDTEGNKIKDDKGVDYLGVNDILKQEGATAEILKMNNTKPGTQEKKKEFTPPGDDDKKPGLHPIRKAVKYDIKD